MSFLLIENIFSFIKTLKSNKPSGTLPYEECFNCFCKQSIPLDLQLLKNHISNCQNYKNESPFQNNFSQLPMNLFQIVHLLALKAEFLNYVEIIDDFLRKKGFQQQSQQESRKSTSQMSQQLSPKQNLQDLKLSHKQSVLDQVLNLHCTSHQYSKSPQIQLMREESKDQKSRSPLSLLVELPCNSEIVCSFCKKTFDKSFDFDNLIQLEKCSHFYCQDCLIKQIQDDFLKKLGNLECLRCGSIITGQEIEKVVGKEQFDTISEKLIEQEFHLIKCSNCNYQFEFENGQSEEFDKINPLAERELAKHFNENRFVCINCKTEQCKSCHAIPYHKGFHCQQFAQQQQSQIKCKFCKEFSQGVDPTLLLCEKVECREKMQLSCSKMLLCGHSCNGFVDESECLDCMNPLCSINNLGQDFCSICQFETLSQAPCIRSSCGHIFHYQCIMKQLQTGRLSNKIAFNFCLCPLCNQWLKFQANSKPQQLIEFHFKLNQKVQQKSLKRLIDEGRNKDEQLQDQTSIYFNKPLEYSLSIYQFFLCFKCQLPYFAGLIACQNAINEEDGLDDPQKLICPQCRESSPLESCEIHGLEYIEYKCKFCCNLAIFYCWGTTHFCQSCHTRQCTGDYMTNIPKEILQQCGGKEKCPLNIDHKLNGEEQALGCYLCKLKH